MGIGSSSVKVDFSLNEVAGEVKQTRPVFCEPRKTLNDVAHFPELQQHLGMKDLRSLARVSLACRDATDNDYIWRQKLAERIQVPLHALVPADGPSSTTRRSMLNAGYRVPVYYKAMSHGWAVYEGRLDEAARVRGKPTSIADGEYVLMQEVERLLRRSVPEVMRVADELRAAITAAKELYLNETRNHRVLTFQNALETVLSGTYVGASATCLNAMAQVIAADAAMFAVSGPAGLVMMKISLAAGLLGGAASCLGLAAYMGVPLCQRLRAQARRRAPHEERLAQLTFQRFMTEYRRLHPLTDDRGVKP